jgi:RNA polymerase sigma-70 factor (ECF subfamily)
MTSTPAPQAQDPRTDHELLAAMAADDGGAFEALVGRWRGRVVNFLVSRGADPDGAEDCAQETFLRVHGYRRSYRPDAPFTAFLFTVARNALLDWKRSRARRQGREAGPAGLEGAAAPERLDTALDHLDLAAALERLPARLREVVELGAVRGLPYQAVATLLGVPEGTVKSRMHHALKELRLLLGAEPRDA